MKRMSPSRKSSKPDVEAKRTSVSSGPEAVALTPPAYGIEFLDRSSSRSEPAPLQAKEGAAIAPAPPAATVHQTAQEGMSGASSGLPYLDVIQRSFGRHDVSGVRAFTGGAARAANRQMGSLAYTSGDAVVFGGAPDLHTSAHEAAHVVQQRAGVRLKDNIGRAGDEYERHADAVADAVVQGRSAEGLLTTMAGDTTQASAETATQHKHGPIQYEFRGGKDGTPGTDPVDEYVANPDVPSLIFGLATYREVTQGRLKDTIDSDTGPGGELRTIDDYNEIVGINNYMFPGYAPPHVFLIREKLEDPGKWYDYVATKPRGDSPYVREWIEILAENKEKIGLYDFGDRGGVMRFVTKGQANPFEWRLFSGSKGGKKIDSKNRLGKNLDPNMRDDITAEEISYFLRRGSDTKTAQKEFEGMGKKKKEALDRWVRRAFFRRTSKLAVDFAVHKLKAKVHFNLAGLTKRDSTDPPTLDGLMSYNAEDQSVDRAVTISELRHILKGIKKGTIPAGSINWYNEY